MSAHHRTSASRIEESDGPTASKNELQAKYGRLRATWEARGGLIYEERIGRLEALRTALGRWEGRACEAVTADFEERSPIETSFGEIFAVQAAIKHTRAHLRRWMKPKRYRTEARFLPGTCRVLHQPKGVVGVIAPWNYPFILALNPVVAAIGAGCRVILKPSEITPRSSRLLEDLLAEVFAPEELAVVQGGPDVSQELCSLGLDHLLFTGSTAVGAQVYEAAARKLTPVTLELGGKSPTIIAPDYSIERAMPHIVTGKLVNSGQTCTAPDYALIPEGSERAFEAAFVATASRFYPSLRDNPDYSCVVNERHARRVRSLAESARQAGCRVVEVNPRHEQLTGHKVAPTIVFGVTRDLPIMREEIFGPVLPVVTYRAIQEAIDYVNGGPRPLALYLFTHQRRTIDAVLQNTISGGVAINETMYHTVQEALPFGGTGESGIGAYHGFAGFETFSHAKAIYHRSRLNNVGSWMWPPYGKRAERIAKMMRR